MAMTSRSIPMHPHEIMESSAPTVRGSFTPDLVSSKTWVIDQLSGLAPRLGTVYVLGSWFGNLGVLMHLDPRVQCDRLINVDHDQRAIQQGQRLTNLIPHNRVYHVCADANRLGYRHLDPNGAVINTSLGNMPNRGWFQRIPPGTLVVLQARDHDPGQEYQDTDHMLREFPLDVLYRGHRRFRDPETAYTRFMLIGRRH